MNESATGDLGSRERRRRETYAALTTHARTLTADRGLNGFTIEELCEEVGVSRRTFFNYFATKEDAVLGAKSADPIEPFAAGFLASGPAAAVDGSGSVPPVALKDALLELFIEAFATLDIPRADVHDFMRAMHAEPALMRRMADSARHRQRALAELICQREGLEADDPYGELVALLVSHLGMASFQQFIGHDGFCSADPGPEASESDDEARTRLAAILTSNFSHASRLFGA
ncbi:TetR/AcrR family transcriptional regulator [Arthrobacter sp.]|uniref:TetR/AcrR family transcriptional regulator n=1 Tax=Arthrobacter sp. TaxID=1667 RepID=UPI003A921BCC